MALPLSERFDYYEASLVPDLSGKTREQLETMIHGLQTEVDMLNQTIRRKQVFTDIQSKESERLKQALDTLLDSAALVNMFLERE